VAAGALAVVVVDGATTTAMNALDGTKMSWINARIVLKNLGPIARNEQHHGGICATEMVADHRRTNRRDGGDATRRHRTILASFLDRCCLTRKYSC
jgi:hypothetical protein